MRCAGSPCSIGRSAVARRLTRRISTSKSALSQTETPFCADAGAGLGIHEGAAAGRQHLRAAVEQARDHARLAGAEVGLAIGGEDFRDGHAGRRLDLGVGIDEGDAEALRQPAADRGLARPHHADEHDRTPPERREQRGLLRRDSRVVRGDLVHRLRFRPAAESAPFTLIFGKHIPRPRAPCQFRRNVMVSGFRSLPDADAGVSDPAAGIPDGRGRLSSLRRCRA